MKEKNMLIQVTPNEEGLNFWRLEMLLENMLLNQEEKHWMYKSFHIGHFQRLLEGYDHCLSVFFYPVWNFGY